MDDLMARANIAQFREQLASEIDADARRRLEDLLVQEEESLVADRELLDDINKHIADGRRRIAQQHVRVIAMEQSNNQELLTQATALLEGMRNTQQLHIRYRLLILRSLRANALAANKSTPRSK